MSTPQAAGAQPVIRHDRFSEGFAHAWVSLIPVLVLPNGFER
jgi:hypothetical protein